MRHIIFIFTHRLYQEFDIKIPYGKTYMSNKIKQRMNKKNATDMGQKSTLVSLV